MCVRVKGNSDNKNKIQLMKYSNRKLKKKLKL